MVCQVEQIYALNNYLGTGIIPGLSSMLLGSQWTDDWEDKSWAYLLQ